MSNKMKISKGKRLKSKPKVEIVHQYGIYAVRQKGQLNEIFYFRKSDALKAKRIIEKGKYKLKKSVFAPILK